MISPFAFAPLNGYGRLFDPLDPPFTEESMIRLGRSMRNELADDPDDYMPQFVPLSSLGAAAVNRTA